MTRILVAAVSVVLVACAALSSARPVAKYLRRPPGDLVACPESRPPALAYLGCALPFAAQEVCANRMEHYCVTAPCPQPWYNRCSSAAACSDEDVMSYVSGSCIEVDIDAQ